MTILASDRPLRALMIAPAFAPALFSEALVNSKLALAMLDAGWDISIYAAPGSGELYSAGWCDPWSRLQTVRREVPAPGQPRASLVGRMTNMAERLCSALRTGHPIAGAGWAERTAHAALAEHRSQPFDMLFEVAHGVRRSDWAMLMDNSWSQARSHRSCPRQPSSDPRPPRPASRPPRLTLVG